MSVIFGNFSPFNAFTDALTVQAPMPIGFCVMAPAHLVEDGYGTNIRGSSFADGCAGVELGFTAPVVSARAAPLITERRKANSHFIGISQSTFPGMFHRNS